MSNRYSHPSSKKCDFFRCKSRFSKDNHNSTYLPLSRPEWFRFNESVHVMVKQKNVGHRSFKKTRLGEKQFPVKSEQLFLGIVAQIHLPTYLFLRNFLY